MKLMTILGTRPDLIKMSRVLPALDTHFEHLFVHTGQNYDYELHGIFFDQMGIRAPDIFMGCAKGTPADAVSDIILKSDQIYEEHKPDAVLFYGDTNSTLAVYPAKRRKIPIFHMEAGNRSFNALVPEETNRKIIDHLSDINMVNSENARRYLIKEGLQEDRIIKTGSPMFEVLEYYSEDIKNSPVLKNLNLCSKKYFVISMHREANVNDDKQLKDWLVSFNRVAQEFGYPIFFSCHPRTKKILEKSKNYSLVDQIHIMPPLGFFDYCCLQKNAACTISDSGTITEEASLLSFPAVTIRKAHERPEGMDEGAVAMCGNPKDLVDSIKFKINSTKESRVVSDYDVPQVSGKVVNTIFSYTDYINRLVWRKHI